MLLDNEQTFLGTVKDNGSHLLECNLKNLKRQAYYHITREQKKNQNLKILKEKNHTRLTARGTTMVKGTIEFCLTW